MRCVNQVFLIGRLGADPEQLATKSGKDMVRFNLATNYSVRRGDEWVEATDWHRIVVFDWMARAAMSRLRKGEPVAVVGNLRQNKWTDQEGNPRSTIEVVARELSFFTAPRTDGPAATGTGPSRVAPSISPALPPQPAQPMVEDDPPF